MSVFEILIAIGWSIDIPQKVAPKSVSGRVVKTLIGLVSRFSGSIHLNSNEIPIDLPIQFSCIILTRSGHSFSFGISSSSLSASLEIFKNHCVNVFLSTVAPERHPLPSITCSLARTVLSTGSQFTKLSFL